MKIYRNITIETIRSYSIPSVFAMAMLVLISFSSCETDVEIPIEYTEPKIVLNAFFGPDDSAKVWLSASKYIYDNSPLQNIVDAQVSVAGENGSPIALNHLGDGWYFNEAWQPAMGNRYLISASHPDYESVSAESFVPEAIQFSTLEFGDWLTTYEEGWEYRYRKISIRFQDPPGKDFYHLRFSSYSFWIYYDYLNDEEVGDTIWEEQPVYVRVPNSSGGLDNYDYRSNFTFTDILFNGTEYIFEGYLEEYLFCNYQEGDSYLKVSLYKIPEEYYFYATSLDNYNVGGDFFFFSQPVQVFTNVENGLGIFSGYSNSVDSLLIEKEDCMLGR